MLEGQKKTAAQLMYKAALEAAIDGIQNKGKLIPAKGSKEYDALVASIERVSLEGTSIESIDLNQVPETAAEWVFAELQERVAKSMTDLEVSNSDKERIITDGDKKDIVNELKFFAIPEEEIVFDVEAVRNQLRPALLVEVDRFKLHRETEKEVAAYLKELQAMGIATAIEGQVIKDIAEAVTVDIVQNNKTLTAEQIAENRANVKDIVRANKKLETSMRDAETILVFRKIDAMVGPLVDAEIKRRKMSGVSEFQVDNFKLAITTRIFNELTKASKDVDNIASYYFGEGEKQLNSYVEKVCSEVAKNENNIFTDFRVELLIGEEQRTFDQPYFSNVFKFCSADFRINLDKMMHGIGIQSLSDVTVTLSNLFKENAEMLNEKVVLKGMQELAGVIKLDPKTITSDQFKDFIFKYHNDENFRNNAHEMMGMFKGENIHNRKDFLEMISKINNVVGEQKIDANKAQYAKLFLEQNGFISRGWFSSVFGNYNGAYPQEVEKYGSSLRVAMINPTVYMSLTLSVERNLGLKGRAALDEVNKILEVAKLNGLNLDTVTFSSLLNIHDKFDNKQLPILLDAANPDLYKNMSEAITHHEGIKGAAKIQERIAVLVTALSKEGVDLVYPAVELGRKFINGFSDIVGDNVKTFVANMKFRKVGEVRTAPAVAVSTSELPPPPPAMPASMSASMPLPPPVSSFAPPPPAMSASVPLPPPPPAMPASMSASMPLPPPPVSVELARSAAAVPPPLPSVPDEIKATFGAVPPALPPLPGTPAASSGMAVPPPLPGSRMAPPPPVVDTSVLETAELRRPVPPPMPKAALKSSAESVGSAMDIDSLNASSASVGDAMSVSSDTPPLEQEGRGGLLASIRAGTKLRSAKERKEAAPPAEAPPAPATLGDVLAKAMLERRGAIADTSGNSKETQDVGDNWETDDANKSADEAIKLQAIRNAEVIKKAESAPTRTVQPPKSVFAMFPNKATPAAATSVPPFPPRRGEHGAATALTTTKTDDKSAKVVGGKVGKEAEAILAGKEGVGRE